MLLESFSPIGQQANAAWNENAPQNRKTLLLHALPALALPILISAINLFLDGQLANTGGLSGIGMRSTLETIQTVLSSAIRILLPFWQLGLFYIAIQISRGTAGRPQHLFEGFRRWGSALRLMLLRAIRYFSKLFLGLLLGSLLYSILPLSSNLTKVIEEISKDPAFSQVSADVLMAEITSRLGFWDLALQYGFCLLFAGILTVPLFYHYRMSDYALLDSEKPGAFQALQESTSLMHGNRVRLFKLDLQFWWYYLLTLLATATSYGDLILPFLGIQLPTSKEWAYMIFALISATLHFILYYLFRGQVETTYACVYNALKASQGGSETL